LSLAYERKTRSDLEACRQGTKTSRAHDNFRRMRTLRTLCLALLAVGLTAVTSACGHTKGVVPVDSPLVQWQPPEDLQPSTAPAPDATPEGKPEAKPGK
jgi:hypothetical protein